MLLSCSGGSGLGLYIAAGIVTLHEGCTLTAASPGEGQGSTFKVVIPVAEAHLEGAGSSRRVGSQLSPRVDGVSAKREMGSTSAKQKGINILVVVSIGCSLVSMFAHLRFALCWHVIQIISLNPSLLLVFSCVPVSTNPSLHRTTPNLFALFSSAF